MLGFFVAISPPVGWKGYSTLIPSLPVISAHVARSQARISTAARRLELPWVRDEVDRALSLHVNAIKFICQARFLLGYHAQIR